MAIVWANCSQNAGKTVSLGATLLANKMIAESEYETVRCERVSSLIVAAKARVWASEGWHVTTTDGDGESFFACGV
jgi:hypothetical protein